MTSMTCPPACSRRGLLTGVAAVSASLALPSGGSRAVEFAGAIERASKLRVVLSLFEHGVPPGYEAVAGSAVGQLLAQCMHEATTPEQRDWYQGEAISLLDRLCDVRPEPREQASREDRIARAEERLSEARAGNAWLTGIRRLLPAACKAVETP